MKYEIAIKAWLARDPDGSVWLYLREKPKRISTNDGWYWCSDASSDNVFLGMPPFGLKPEEGLVEATINYEL